MSGSPLWMAGSLGGLWAGFGCRGHFVEIDRYAIALSPRGHGYSTGLILEARGVLNLSACSRVRATMFSFALFFFHFYILGFHGKSLGWKHALLRCSWGQSLHDEDIHRVKL